MAIEIGDLNLTSEAELAFSELVHKHDLTYQFSDDPDVWRRGLSEFEEIVRESKKLELERAVQIWNHWCRQKVKESRIFDLTTEKLVRCQND